MNIVDRIGKKQMEKVLAQRTIPEFGAGDTVRVDVKVVENEADCVHITMPAAPLGHEQISDEDLQHAAGGCDPNMLTFNTTVSPNRTCHAC